MELSEIQYKCKEEILEYINKQKEAYIKDISELREQIIELEERNSIQKDTIKELKKRLRHG